MKKLLWIIPLFFGMLPLLAFSQNLIGRPPGVPIIIRPFPQTYPPNFQYYTVPPIVTTHVVPPIISHQYMPPFYSQQYGYAPQQYYAPRYYVPQSRAMRQCQIILIRIRHRVIEVEDCPW